MATETVSADMAQRVHLASDAAGELMSLAVLLQREFASGHFDSDQEWLRGASVRLEGLASVILSALNDDGELIDEIRQRFEGPEAERRATRARHAQGAAA